VGLETIKKWAILVKVTKLRVEISVGNFLNRKESISFWALGTNWCCEWVDSLWSGNDNGHYGENWNLFLQGRLSCRWKQQLVSVLKTYKTVRCHELYYCNLFLITLNQPDWRHIYFVLCDYTGCFFGSKEHNNFHLPGYRATTTVLGIAIEEKHRIFWSHYFTYQRTKVSFVMDVFSLQKKSLNGAWVLHKSLNYRARFQSFYTSRHMFL
jgi:hypothetical protein